jgi:hypothetical protein
MSSMLDSKYIMSSIISSHFDSTTQSAVQCLNPDEVKRVGGAGHKVIM